MFDDIFKSKKLVPKKLLEYGFKKENGVMIYRTDILDDTFSLVVTADGSDAFDTLLFDKDTDLPYDLYKTTAEGAFLGKVRGKIEDILIDISDKCCIDSIFKSEQSERIIRYIRDTYSDEPEFLWPRFPENAIWRKKSDGKWYGLIMSIIGSRIGLDTDKKIDIIDLRMDPEKKDQILCKRDYYPAWHMNKNSWYTIVLNDSISDNELKMRISESYILA